MTRGQHPKSWFVQWRTAVVLVLFGCCSVALIGCYQSSGISAPQVTVESLIRLLHDPDMVVRRTAAEALGKIGNRQAAPSLVPALDDAREEVREAAVRSLSQMGPLEGGAGERVAGLLVDPVSAVRQAAAQSLISLELMRELWPLVVPLVADADPEVRGVMLQALEGVQAREVLKIFDDALRDPDPRVRRAAVVSLAETGDSQVGARLRERLTSDASGEVRAEAAYRLQFFPLTDTGALKLAAGQDGHSQVRRWAEQTLKGLEVERDSDSRHQPARPAVPAPSHQYP